MALASSKGTQREVTVAATYRYKLLALLLFLLVGLIERPAFAQIDLSGKWAEAFTEDEPELAPGSEIGDYTELPINEAARMRADTWDAQKWEMIEHECDPHGITYAPFGFSMQHELTPFTQALLAWEMRLDGGQVRTIYMDGRPHPSENALHTWEGFSTGEWEGDMLKVTVTHMKEAWLKRNGVPRSERATFIQYFVAHGEFMTLVTDYEDPVYLTEPFVRHSNFIRSQVARFRPNYCLPSISVEHPEGYVAYHLPGKNAFLTEFASRWGIPVEAARGGAETRYPEYQNKLANMPAPPELPAHKQTKQ
jgi:hypothetical protein